MSGCPDLSSNNVCHRCEAYFSAVGGKEDMFVDKKTIDCQLKISLELDELLRDLDHTLDKALCISSYGVPFILRIKQPQITLMALASAGVTSQPRILALTISLKSAEEGNKIIS